MIVEVSVIPGFLYGNINRKRKVTPIFQHALSTLLSQESPKMEIIVGNLCREELLRRKYPDPNYPNESPADFCIRVEKEIKDLI